ncbi:hypothetical protein JKP88DRAFT_264148 [Tribonema minus]|uniref:Uncharacterized protein n=1 Tax=Tribonema minus TaxID=303371 RepID=A0A835Z0K2_9STRA|nr:hypothetical protein JKP88DRAFT_264148 [Tribonema minus]
MVRVGHTRMCNAIIFGISISIRTPLQVDPHLQIRYAYEDLVEVQGTANAWASQGDDGKRTIRMPRMGTVDALVTPATGVRGRERPPSEKSPHARVSRALTITKYLYEQVPGAAFIYLRGTSFNTANATCVQNAHTAMQCFEGAVCDLDAKFPKAIKAVDSKLELKELVDPNATLVAAATRRIAPSVWMPTGCWRWTARRMLGDSEVLQAVLGGARCHVPRNAQQGHDTAE